MIGPVESRHGLLDVNLITAADGTTRIAHRRQRFPLHLTTPLYLDPREPGMAFLYVQNPSGGVFGGDRSQLRVTAEEGARVHVTTPSATKVYRTDGAPAQLEVMIRVGPGAYVEYLPEPLIPHGGSILEQCLSVDLARSATFVAAETVGPGRLARGELFAYERLSLRTTVTREGTEVMTDTLLLEPARRPPQSRGMLGSFHYLTTVIALTPANDAEELAEALDAAVGSLPETLAAAGVLPSQAGAIVRVLARSSGASALAVDIAWRIAREALLGTPPPRRRK